MGFHAYDPADIKLVFGVILIDGYADGSFVNVTANSDLFTMQKGADGETTRSKSNDRSARVVVRLMPGSAANIALSAQFNSDLAANAGVVPIELTDLGIGTVMGGANAWIVREPGRDYQVESQAIEWTIDVADLSIVHGAAL